MAFCIIIYKGSQPQEDSEYEGIKGDLDVVDRDAQKHIHFAHLLIHRHGVVIGNILHGHVHIGIAQDHSHERAIAGGREGSDDCKKNEDCKGKQQLFVILVKLQRKFFGEEAKEPVPRFTAGGIDLLMRL